MKQSTQTTSLSSKLQELAQYNTTFALMTGQTLTGLFRNSVHLAEGHQSWTEYIKQPEFGLSVGEASKLMKMYSLFIETMGYSLEDLQNKNLKALKKIETHWGKRKLTKEQVRELVEKSEHLSLADVAEEIADTQSTNRTYEYVVMKRCIETNGLTKEHELTRRFTEWLSQGN